jgi:hypothetical protein
MQAARRSGVKRERGIMARAADRWVLKPRDARGVAEVSWERKFRKGAGRE